MIINSSSSSYSYHDDKGFQRTHTGYAQQQQKHHTLPTKQQQRRHRYSYHGDEDEFYHFSDHSFDHRDGDGSMRGYRKGGGGGVGSDTSSKNGSLVRGNRSNQNQRIINQSELQGSSTKSIVK